MKKNRSACSLVNTLDIVGDKWSLVIIRDLFLGKKTFTEFLHSPEKIATNILSNRLEFLKFNQLIEVTKRPNDNKTKIYYLTDKGINLYPVLYEMMHWSKNNLDSEIGPISRQWFKDIEEVEASEVIKDTKERYIKLRSEIFAFN